MLLDQYPKLELSTKLIIAEALNRGVTVEVLDEADNFIRLRKGERVEYIKQATKTSVDSYIVPLIMENKEVTKLVLREAGIYVPAGITVSTVEQAMDVWTDYEHKDIVVKPKSTNFGEGVQILRLSQQSSVDAFVKAIEQALEFDDVVMLEEFIPGKEYRFLVINDEVVAVLHRIPANVQGDGIHTIQELVTEKNKHPLRGVGHVTPFEKINLGSIELECLRQQGMSIESIPQQDEIVYLRENSNVSTGGDSIDFTDDIASEYKDIAIKAVQAVGAKICGLDMIILDIQQPPTDNNHSIIELNFNPAIYLHNYPYQGINRQVEKKVLDLLEL